MMNDRKEGGADLEEQFEQLRSMYEKDMSALMEERDYWRKRCLDKEASKKKGKAAMRHV